MKALIAAAGLISLAAAQSPERIKAFGLDALSWGMSADQLQKALPGVHPAASDIPGDIHLTKDQQTFSGCRARVDFDLPGGKLAAITLTADEDFSGCTLNIVEYLTSLYGPTYDVVQGNWDAIFKWKGPTSIAFTTASAESVFKGVIEMADARGN